MAAPVAAPDAANRCLALGDPRPQAFRQQQLVCLTGGHVDCPRYLRTALARPRTRRRAGGISPAILAAAAMLAASAATSFAFVLSRGSLTLPSSGATHGIAAAVATPAPASPMTPRATARPTRSLRPTASPSPAPTLTPPPSVIVVAVATPRPTARPTPSPRPVSSRYRLLDPCPRTPRCWIYTVREGDNLYSIANYFGHSLETVYRLNPWARTTPLRAGQQLLLPPPTR